MWNRQILLGGKCNKPLYFKVYLPNATEIAMLITATVTTIHGQNIQRRTLHIVGDNHTPCFLSSMLQNS